MTNRVLPLQDLAQRIDQQQAELAKLRREYEARQVQLSNLTRRKQELQAQLQKVDAEMKSMGSESKPASAPTAGKTAPAKAVAAKPVAPMKPTAGKKPGERVSLPKLLIQIVAKSKGPVTTKELAQEVVRRKYPTTSNNLLTIVETRAHELVKKGIFRRAKDHAGLVMVKPMAASTTPAPAVKPKTAPATMPKTPALANKSAVKTSPAANSNLSLPDVVTKILAMTEKPVSARELAGKVLASGYHSKSKDFTNVIWAGVGKMDNVENVPGQGYRLKKSKSPVAASKAKSSK